MRACPSCGEANPDRFSACAFCGTALVERASAQEERKTLTVVFCDLKDSTKLGELLDPEPLGEVLDLYFTAMTRVLKRHGGSIEKFIGDAVVAAFGIPVLHEDDALRAVRAAVEMREALARLNLQLDSGYGVTLTTRIGVHTGEVVIRTAATDQQVLTGDTLNTAARLEQTAGAGEILIGEPTYRLVRGAVEVEAVPPLELKGKGEPVPAYRLHRVFGDEQSSRRHLAPLVGRTDELRALVEGFERAGATRECRLVTVLGEAGVGKSRLVRALVDSARDSATILRGRCLPYGESITFWPLLAIVREAAGIDQDEAGDAARAKVERLSGDPEVARRVASALDWSSEELPLPELFWGLRELLEGLARARPLVVVIDDVHWASPTLLELIDHLLERVSDAPLLVVCTARPTMLDTYPEWGSGAASTRIVLGRLADEASAELLANMTGGLELPDGVRAKVLEAAEGNPLFVEQLMSMLTDRGLLVQAGSRWEVAASLARLEIPPSIQALLAARLDGLDPDERGVVDPASVIGLEFPSVAVSEIAAPSIRDTTPARLAELVQKRLVREEISPDEVNDYRFDHLLIRDAAYGGVLKRSRAELHEQYADWLEASEGPQERDEVIGYHLEQATGYRGQLGPIDEHARALATRASDKLATAGRRAFARGDLPAAIDLLGRALETLPGDDPARVGLMPDLAEALLEAGEFDLALASLSSIDDAPDDSISQCAVARGRLVRLLVDL
ncbi:MAG TPA: adenylate/guanylate cyclase domain-containing protein, partial [Candidatus Limnocylindria bacterium]